MYVRSSVFGVFLFVFSGVLLAIIKVGNAELSNAGEDSTQRRGAVLKSVRTAAQLMQANSPQRRYELSER